MSILVEAHQTDPRLGDVGENLAGIVAAVRASKARLVVFPECALTGYGFDSRERGLKVAEAVPGPATKAVQAACRESRAWAVVGLLERDGPSLYNSAALVGPDGVAGVYRKMHLPFLGIDRFTDKGDRGFPVFEAPFGRVGILICYDLSFPEAARVLKLGGAQVVVVPTNWPEAATVSCEHSPPVRASENHVNVVTCNRTGEEAGFRFLGRSRMCDFAGRVLTVAGPGEEVVAAELDLAEADRNRVVNVPGMYELDRIADRRPEAYAAVTRPGR
jgi:predicted amidohydrolase